MVFNVLKFYLDKREISKNKAARYLGMTSAGFWRALENETLKAKDMLKLAAWLNIPPAELFDKRPPRAASNITNDPPGVYSNDVFTQYLEAHTELLKRINILIDKGHV